MSCKVRNGRLHGHAGSLVSKYANPEVTYARAAGAACRSGAKGANLLSFFDGFALPGFTVVRILLLMLLLSPAPSQEWI